jgi:hypothetical protein
MNIPQITLGGIPASHHLVIVIISIILGLLMNWPDHTPMSRFTTFKKDKP